MKKIHISDKLAKAGINYLNEQPGIQIHTKTGLNEDGLCKIIGDYDALLQQLCGIAAVRQETWISL